MNYYCLYYSNKSRANPVFFNYAYQDSIYALLSSERYQLIDYLFINDQLLVVLYIETIFLLIILINQTVYSSIYQLFMTILINSLWNKSRRSPLSRSSKPPASNQSTPSSNSTSTLTCCAASMVPLQPLSFWFLEALHYSTKGHPPRHQQKRYHRSGPVRYWQNRHFFHRCAPATRPQVPRVPSHHPGPHPLARPTNQQSHFLFQRVPKNQHQMLHWWH